MRFLLTAVLTLGALTQPSVAVNVRTFQFMPDTLRIVVGTTVRWTNQDAIEHTVTTGTPERPDGVMQVILGAKGSVAARTFERPGTWMYFCDRHRFMRGVITVTRENHP
jgi:plastocyanin